MTPINAVNLGHYVKKHSESKASTVYFTGSLLSASRNSNQSAFKIAKVQARPVPKIHEKYHI